MLLTIIIPIYNKEKTLTTALDSILNQGLPLNDCEVILIDDGSTDNSYNICKSYAQKNNLFKIISKQNEGVSQTRNLGISIAKGDYLYFMDADDYLIPNGLSVVINNFLDDSFDIIDFQYKFINIDDININTSESTDGIIIKELNGLEYLSTDTPVFIWHSLYKKSFLVNNKLSFDDIPYSEDFLFNITAYNKNCKIRCISNNIYRYVKYNDDNNLSTNRSPEFLRKVIDGYIIIFKRMAEMHKNHIENGISQPMNGLFNTRLIPFTSRILSSDISVKELKIIKNELIQTGLFENNKIHFGRNQKICHFVINNPVLFPIFRLFYKKFFLLYFLPKIKKAKLNKHV